MTGHANLIAVVRALRHANGHLFTTVLQGELELGPFESSREVDRDFARHVAALGGGVGASTAVTGEEVPEEVPETCAGSAACAGSEQIF